MPFLHTMRSCEAWNANIFVLALVNVHRPSVSCMNIGLWLMPKWLRLCREYIHWCEACFFSPFGKWVTIFLHRSTSHWYSPAMQFNHYRCSQNYGRTSSLQSIFVCENKNSNNKNVQMQSLRSVDHAARMWMIQMFWRSRSKYHEKHMETDSIINAKSEFSANTEHRVKPAINYYDTP